MLVLKLPEPRKSELGAISGALRDYLGVECGRATKVSQGQVRSSSFRLTEKCINKDETK